MRLSWCDRDPVATRLPPDFPHAVGPEALFPDPLDFTAQLGVPLGMSRELAGIAPPGAVLAIGRQGDRRPGGPGGEQQPADRLAPMDVAVIVPKTLGRTRSWLRPAVEPSPAEVC
jgi:hypothetical protein